MHSPPLVSFRGDEHASLSTFLDLLGVRRLGLLGVLVFGLLGVRCLGLFGVLVFGLLGVRRLGLLGVLRLGLLGTLSVVGFRGMPFFSLFFFFQFPAGLHARLSATSPLSTGEGPMGKRAH